MSDKPEISVEYGRGMTFALHSKQEAENLEPLINWWFELGLEEQKLITREKRNDVPA